MTLPWLTSIYLIEYADEVTPSTLEGWAEFLIGGGDWGYIGKRPSDGQTFAAERVTYWYVAATRQPDGTYTIPKAPAGTVYHAVAYGPAVGWNAEMMTGATDDSRADVAALLAEFGTDSVEWVACRDKPESITVTFRNNPVRCEIEGATHV